jgi:hypothetical protein
MASTIKVDNVQNQPGTNIINKCSTTITIGASSDTVALACGASQTGFGRTGTVDWITTPKVTGDSPVTGVTGKGYFLNTTAGQITLNLPAGSAGDIISMADYAATWQTNKVTVSPNGSEKIGSLNEDATLDTEGQSVTFVYVDSTQGWINTMDSTSNVRGAPPYIVATGGTPCSGAIVCTNYKQHTFTGPGTFTVCSVASCAANNAVAYMVVAGGGTGGDGGTGEGGGGGGAGGFREGTTAPIVPYTASPLVAATGITVTATGYPITIGAGGTPGVGGGSPAPAPVGTNGNPSTFSCITSAGGGLGTGGGAHSGMGGTGGSGGGGNARCGPGTPGNRTGQAGNTPPVSPPQGNTGGNGCGTPARGGGGGGATAVGGPSVPTPTTGGVGGAGATTSIDGTPTAYAGGGGGGNQGGPSPTGGAGGTGGGGQGGKNQVGDAGTVNTGGGGGGNSCGGNYPPTGNGGAGGSGVVVIRYRFQ